MSALHLRPDTGEVFLLQAHDPKSWLVCPLCSGSIRVAEKINLYHGAMEDGAVVTLSGMALCFVCRHGFPLQHIRASVKLCPVPVALSDVFGDWTRMSFVEHRRRGAQAPRPDQAPTPPVQKDAVSSEPEIPDVASAIALYYAGRHVL